MQNTPNYNYNLPEYSDSADIAVLNANFSSIDSNEYRIEGKLNALGNDIALPYDNTATYSVGDYAIYNNSLYRCITAIATAEDFDDTKWTAITIGGELKSHDTRISTLEAGVELEGEATNSFDDGIDSYFKKVVSSIVPVQAGTGTPSPSNPRAISGFTECTVWDRQINQWDEDWEVGDIDRTTGQNRDSSLQIRSKNYIPVSPDTSYYIGIFKAGEANIAVCYYDARKNFISSEWGSNRIRRVPINCYYIRFTTNTAYGTTYNNDISINYPATETAYHAYNGTTATISFGSAGTVYGGYVDLISGKLVVDRGYLAPTEVKYVNQAGGVYYWVVAQSIGGVDGGADIIMSSHFEGASGLVAGHTYVIGGGNNLVAIPTDQSLSTKPLADAWLQANNPQFVYKLATPQEYQLTPAKLRSLVGTNNLTSNTGDTVEVEYITNETIAWLLDLIRA